MSVVVALAVLSSCQTEDVTSLPEASDSGERDRDGRITVDCSHRIDELDSVPDGYQRVAGIALPSSGRGTQALQVASGNVPNQPYSLFAKAGLVVKADEESILVVADSGDADVAGLRWGNDDANPPSQELVVPACSGLREWIVFPGGFYVDAPTCLTVRVTTSGKEDEMDVGVGAACDGQRPPVGGG